MNRINRPVFIICLVLTPLQLRAASPQQIKQYTISTVAGIPVTQQSTRADGVGIGSPNRVAADSSGNVYFSVNSQVAGLIYKVDASGALWHVAGTLRGGYSGDGGPAINAALSGGSGGLTNGNLAIAADSTGGLYIADTNNHRVRKVSADGVITTVAGTGTPGCSGDGGPATKAQLKSPSGVAVDVAGNLLIADTWNYRIRKVSPDGTITTVAGGHPASTDWFGDIGDNGPADNAVLNLPTGLAVDTLGNLYIADTFNSRVRKISSTGLITTFAGYGPPGWNLGYSPPPYPGNGNPATKAYFYHPVSIATDAAGNLYLPDNGTNGSSPFSCIRRISPTGILSTVAGSGPPGYSGDTGNATNARLGSPAGIAVGPQGEIYIADTSNNRIRQVSVAGIIVTTAGNGSARWWSDWQGGYSGDFGPATSAMLSFPSGVAVDSSGNLYVADAGNHRVRRVSRDGVIVTAAGNGSASFSGDGGTATEAGLNWPFGVEVDWSGNLWIADSANYRVRKVSSDGFITTVIGNGSANFPYSSVPHEFINLGDNLDGAYQPGSLAVDVAGKLYIADTDDGVAVDALTGLVYFTDSRHAIVQAVDHGPLAGSGALTVAGTGIPGDSGDGGPGTSAQLASPQAVAVDAQGNLYVADCAAYRIRKVFPDGTITTIAGNGTSGYSGDGGPATDATLSCPTGLTADGDGNIYVAEPFNGVVRMLKPVRAPAEPGAEWELFADIEPGDESKIACGTRVGGGAAAGNLGTTVGQQFGLRYAPKALVALSHIEIVAARITGSQTVDGYLMTDEDGPGTIIEKFSFRAPPGASGVTSASSAVHPVLSRDRLYWFALAAQDPVNDMYWWTCGSHDWPYSQIAERIGDTGQWKLYSSRQGFAFRVYGVETPVSMGPPTITAVVNAASGRTGIAAGSLASIYGSNLSGVPYSDWSGAIVNGRLPIQLGGVSVIIGGMSAYIAGVTPTQINVQVPDLSNRQGIGSAVGASAQLPVIVTAPGGVSAPFTTPALLYSPAFFLWPGNQPVATHLDFTLAAKIGTFQGNVAIPAKPGEVVVLWGTGFGPSNPDFVAGHLPTTGAAARSAVSVMLGGTPATMISATLSGSPGLYQIAVQIPATMPDGDYAVTASVNGVVSPSNVFLTVHH
jgi:uncharacterized protein (TIGR03437 family)